MFTSVPFDAEWPASAKATSSSGAEVTRLSAIEKQSAILNVQMRANDAANKYIYTTACQSLCRIATRDRAKHTPEPGLRLVAAAGGIRAVCQRRRPNCATATTAHPTSRQ